MSHANTIPDNKSFSAVYSLSQSLGATSTVKLVPKNPDGSIFDCTAYTDAQILVAAPNLTNPAYQSGQSMTVGTHDATGIVVTMSLATLPTIMSVINNQAPRVTVELFDGSGNSAIANVGNLAIALIP